MAASARERTRRWQKLHPEFRQRADANRARRLEVVDRLKDNPCEDCKQRFPRCVMDWDHVRGTKVSNVARMRNANVPIERILDEIAKCDLVCSNCHRIRTFTRSDGFYQVSRGWSGRKREQ